MWRVRPSDTERVVYLLLDILIVLIGASLLLYRGQLARYIAGVQQTLSRAWPWAYPGVIGRFYTSESAWRHFFIPVLGVAFVIFGLVWLWNGGTDPAPGVHS